MADEPENLVLVLLRQLGDKVDSLGARLDAKIGRVDAKVDSLASDQTAMRADIAAIKAEQLAQSRTLYILRHAIAPGEMEAANEDLAQLRREVDALTVRLEAIEERQKDH